MFKCSNQDQSGEIDKKEFLLMVGMLGLDAQVGGKKAANKAAKCLFKEIDESGDGLIQIDEFSRFLRRARAAQEKQELAEKNRIRGRPEPVTRYACLRVLCRASCLSLFLSLIVSTILLLLSLCLSLSLCVSLCLSFSLFSPPTPYPSKFLQIQVRAAEATGGDGKRRHRGAVRVRG